MSETDDVRNSLLRELNELLGDINLMLEEERIEDYFKRETQTYLIDEVSRIPPFVQKMDGIVQLVKKRNIRLIDSKEFELLSTNELEKLFLPDLRSSEFIISFSRAEFIESITSTYKDDQSIVRQFLCDFDRQIVKINDIPYDNVDELFFKLSNSNRLTNVRGRSNPNQQMTLLMLSNLLTCQSSHYNSFNYAFEAVNKIRDDAIIHDINRINNGGGSAKSNYYVMSGSDNFNTVELIIDNESIGASSKMGTLNGPELGCIINSAYKIVDTENESTPYKIFADTIFSERSDLCLIRYKVQKL